MKEMVRRTGVHERLLRYYEQQGLLAPDRLPSGYREFSEADVRTVRRIRCLLTAGLSTATIARVLPCVRDVADAADAGEGEGENGGRLAPTCPSLVGRLRADRDRITGEIEALHTSRTILDSVLDAAPRHLTETPAESGTETGPLAVGGG